MNPESVNHLKILTESSETFENLNYDLLAQQILIELRGELSQTQLSQNLGFSFNQVGKWESGVTNITWSDFIDICTDRKINWQESFNKTFSFHTGMLVERDNVFEILSKFWDKNDSAGLMKALSKSISTVVRLKADSSKITMSDVLKLADVRPFVLNVWLGQFLKPMNLKEFQPKYEREQLILSGLVTLPWTPLVNACFWLVPYQELEEHSDLWIAKKIGLSEAQVKKSIQVLHAHDIIFLSDGKFKSTIKDFTFMRREEVRLVTQFVLQKMTQAFSTNAPVQPNYLKPSLNSQKIYPVSLEASKKIADTLVEFHHKINEILKTDQGHLEHVRVINIQSVDLELCPDLSDSEL